MKPNQGFFLWNSFIFILVLTNKIELYKMLVG